MSHRRLSLLAALLAASTVLCTPQSALADFTFTQGTGQTGFSFTAGTGGTALCAASVTHCFASVPINTAGAQLFTSGAPGLVTLTGTNNINNIAGTISLPTGAATQTTLASILSSLGSPFQAGGSIGNATFGATQSGAWNITNITGTVSLPTGAATETTLSTMSGKLPTSLTTAGADGVSNTLSGLQTYSRQLMFNGTTWDRVPGDTTNGLWVNVKNSTTAIGNNADAVAVSTGGNSPVVGYNTVFNGTTWDRMPGTTAGVTVRSPTAANFLVTLPAETTKVLGTFRMQGNVGGVLDAVTGATAPANALQTGCVAQSAEATAITGGQIGGYACDLVKKIINLPYANPENQLNGEITSAMTATTSTALTGMGAQGGSFRVYATACTFSNTHATVGTMINLQDGSGGAVLWQAPAAAVYGGAVVPFPTPIKTTANTGLFAVNATTGASTLVSCTGYKGL